MLLLVFVIQIDLEFFYMKFFISIIIFYLSSPNYLLGRQYIENLFCVYFFLNCSKKNYFYVFWKSYVCVCICVQILDPKFWYCITEMQWFRTTVSKMCVNYQIYKFHWIQKPTQPMLRSILIGYISIHPFCIQICMTCAKSHGLRLKHVISVMFRRCILNKLQIRQIHTYLSPIRKLVFIMLKKVSNFHHALYFGEIIFKF